MPRAVTQHRAVQCGAESVRYRLRAVPRRVAPTLCRTTPGCTHRQQKSPRRRDERRAADPAHARTGLNRHRPVCFGEEMRGVLRRHQRRSRLDPNGRPSGRPADSSSPGRSRAALSARLFRVGVGVHIPVSGGDLVDVGIALQSQPHRVGAPPVVVRSLTRSGA